MTTPTIQELDTVLKEQLPEYRGHKTQGNKHMLRLCRGNWCAEYHLDNHVLFHEEMLVEIPMRLQEWFDNTLEQFLRPLRERQNEYKAWASELAAGDWMCIPVEVLRSENSPLIHFALDVDKVAFKLRFS